MRTFLLSLVATALLLTIYEGLGYKKMDEDECRDALMQQILETNGWDFYLTTPRVEWTEEENAIHAQADSIVRMSCDGLAEAGVVRRR